MIIIIRLFFWSALINRGNKITTFEQSQCALISRGKLINLQKLEEFFDKFSFKEMFNICKYYFLEVSFFISVFVFNVVFSLLFALLYTSIVSPRVNVCIWRSINICWRKLHSTLMNVVWKSFPIIFTRRSPPCFR